MQGQMPLQVISQDDKKFLKLLQILERLNLDQSSHEANIRLEVIAELRSMV